MSTNDIREDIKAYLDGELSEERSAQVRDAIAADPQLQQEMQMISRITNSLKAMTRGPQPMGEARAVSNTTPRRWNFRLINLAMAGGAALILLTMIVPAMLQNARSDRSVMSAPSVGFDAETAAPSESMGGVKMEQKSQDAFAPGRARNASPATSPPAPSGDTLDMPRAVVRTGSLTVKVVNAESAEQSVTNLVKGWRGYIESSESTNLESRYPSITMILRVPEQHFDDAIKAFEQLGTRTAKTVSGQDVTAQIVDMSARIKNLRAQEETYRQILRQAKRVGEVIEVQQHLSQIRGEIESMDAQMQSLKKLAALSTITLTLMQRPSGEHADGDDSGWASDAWAAATKALSGAFRSLATAAIFLFVYAPLWLPILFVMWIAYRRYAKA